MAPIFASLKAFKQIKQDKKKDTMNTFKGAMIATLEAFAFKGAMMDPLKGAG